MYRAWIAACAALSVLAACQSAKPPASTARSIDARALEAAAANTRDWLTTGRTYAEERYTSLDRINAGNVRALGLAWHADLDTARGQEATPLVIDGRIYITTAWSKVKAFDARTGALLWAYDPAVPGKAAVRACCDVVNRGLAAWGDRLYLATLDGRLIALERSSGRPVWMQRTVDADQPYAISGAPRVIKGRVIIGNQGAEMGVRGYVSAYDAETGRPLWRFYTVPDQPGRNTAPYLARAEATWTGRYWALGGGGTVWDSMSYDPELDLLYIGTGNGSPWNQSIRSPGGGDNLYLSSIVALRPETGEYVWHYQTTPGDTWDFDSTQNMILADLVIGGERRKVLMQAPKNGFFYVLDRVNGKLISGHPFVPVSWAKGIDAQSGRPIENPQARFDRTGKPALVLPGPGGAHSWHPMAYDPATGLVYIPAQLAAFPYIPDTSFHPATQGFNTGIDFAAAAMPADPKVRAGALANTRGALIAWDPVSQAERWRVEFKGPWNGGVLATGGGLVFQGSSAREFAAYDAASGAKLWSRDVQTGVIAAPVSYELDGEQYVAVLAGWGGVWALTTGVLSEVGGPVRNRSRLLVFRLGGSDQLPPEPPDVRAALDPPLPGGTAAQVSEGGRAYARFCGVCHGDAAWGGTVLPDLRRSALLADPAGWARVVHDGALEDAGMVSFAKVLDAGQTDAIRHYVIMRANEDKALGAK